MDATAGLRMLGLTSISTDVQPLLAQLSLSLLLLPKKVNFLVHRSLPFPISVWNSWKLRVNVSSPAMEPDVWPWWLLLLFHCPPITI